jgi:hypothetical protein
MVREAQLRATGNDGGAYLASVHGRNGVLWEISVTLDAAIDLMIVATALVLFYVWIFRGGRMIDRMLTDYYKKKIEEAKADRAIYSGDE